MRSAPAPEGPWSRPVQAFKAMAPVGDPGWVYDALPHPEVSPDGGRTQYVTYSRSTGPFASEMRVVEVVLE